MDACLAVDREVDKVLSRFEDMSKSYNDVLQQMIDNLEIIQKDWQNNVIKDGKVLTISSFLQLMSDTIYKCSIYLQ